MLASTGCSSQYGLSFSSNTLNLASGCTSVSPSNSTSCSDACIYASGNLTYMPVYTPACFEPPSSLSHFEDMCYPTNNPLNNDQYFSMSNANGAGTSKRYLKPEERKVLCDLGYTVATTYTSNAYFGFGILTGGVYTYTYSGSGCTPPNIWGQNDGFVNGAYSYTSTGGVINFSVSTGINNLLSNDATSAITASCVQLVYNTGTVTTNYTTGVVSYTPAAGYTGHVLLRYIPVDASANQGNITYVHAYVLPGVCSPVSPCDLVQNGNFESQIGCGPIGGTVTASCWIPYTLSPDLFVRNCATSSITANLGTNTYSSTISGSLTPFNSHSPLTGNDAVVGLGAVMTGTGLTHSESYAN